MPSPKKQLKRVEYLSRPIEDRGPKVLRYEHELEALWAALFETPVHLDSALSKLAPAARAALAPIVPRILSVPVSLARALELPLRAGEPWSLEGRELARWHGPREMVRRLYSRFPAAPEKMSAWLDAIVGGADDFPQAWQGEVTLACGVDGMNKVSAELTRNAPLILRCARAFDRAQVAADILKESEARFGATALSPAGLRSDRFARVLKTSGYAAGQFEIQDEGSQVMAWFALWPELFAGLLSDRPGAKSKAPGVPIVWPEGTLIQTWVDACSGAGGKALAIGDAMRGKGKVFAYDVSGRKLQALRKRASRAGLRNIQPVEIPAEAEPAAEALAKFKTRADGVLVDAPCSGWGVLRRNPDIKWRQSRAELERLPELQYNLLSRYSTLVRPGGRLVFGVCTFRRAETTEVVDRFLAENPRFTRGPGGYLGPGVTDGFFMQSLELAK